MSEMAHYYFIPSLRQGLSAAIPYIDAESTAAVFSRRASFSVNLAIGATGFPDEGETIQKSIELYGPGDIIGFDERIISRTDPRNNVGDFEPNYFPMIEFATDPDFPWRYTANQFSSEGKLAPWITLIVLVAETAKQEAKEFEEGDRSITDQKPYITVHSQRSLPNCGDSWRWAHVKLTSDNSILDGDAPNHDRLHSELESALRNNPEKVVSSLLCPRRLRPGILYNAFVVPTFELGRIATGLAPRPLSEGVELNSLTHAWNHESSDPIDLPYYYKWEFRTGLRGDFEHLVRLLEPRELSDLGKRKMDCSNPGYGLTNFTRIDIDAGMPEVDPDYRVTEMEGALQSFNTDFTPWGKDSAYSGDDPHVFQTTLAEQLLNRPKADLVSLDSVPVVGPPVYGRWHRGRTVSDNQYVKPGSAHISWIDELNLDPRHRAAAGLGTEVIKKQQEDLMAAAWDQLGAVEEANEQLCRAQLAREVSKCTEKRFKSLSLFDYIRNTSPLLKRVKDQHSGNALAETFKLSRIPDAVLDPAFQRIARKRGSIRKRQRLDMRPPQDILQRFNDKSIKTAGSHTVPGGMVDICNITDKLIESISLDNEPPEFISTPPERHPPGQLVYTAVVVAPEADQDMVVVIDRDLTETNFPSGYSEIVKIPDTNQWRVVLELPTIPAIGDEGDFEFPDGSVLSPGGGVITPGGTIPVIAPLYLTLNAIDKGVPVGKTLQVLQFNAVQSDSQWTISSENIPFPIVYPDFPESKRFCTKSINSELLNKPEILIGLEEDDIKILEATHNLMDDFLASDQVRTSKPEVNFDEIKQTLVEAVDPEVSIPKRVLRRVGMQNVQRNGDLLNKIMSAPEFPQPMYEPLRDISQDLLLPGLENIPLNTISLLQTNNRFIESYMVGLNHEFSRELLWREYPTDQRGTYFRQFWDASERVPDKSELDGLLLNYLSEYNVESVAELPDENKEKIVQRNKERVGDYENMPVEKRNEWVVELIQEEQLEEKYKDITKIHTWRGNQLGTNRHRSDEDMVLIVRGDLLKRYPNTVIYAVQAVHDEQGEVIPDMPEYTDGDEPGVIKFPIFNGTLPPDVTFVGFDMGEIQAWGCGEELGWYFVLEERVSEPRFGLDSPSDVRLNNWDDLAWHHFNLAEQYGRYLDTSAISPDALDVNEWDSSSSKITRRVLQKPFRICIHAKQMLPRDPCSSIEV